MTEMIALGRVVKVYPGTQAAALKGVSLSIQNGEFFTLLGPSGCGKTTLLRCIAGLENPDGGSIRIGGRTVFDAQSGINVGPDKRNIGMVFQSYAIWPHMTVFENVAFPLRCRGERDLRERVLSAMTVVGLQDYADRYSSRLSGGQQQRVALARALVAQPDVLLLDEPLSNLDAALRTQMRAELRRLQREVGITTVLVTHDQHEALAISDRIAVMAKGEVLEVGTPRALYDQPATLFSAHFLGCPNQLPGALKAGDDAVITPIGALRVRGAPGPGEVVCFIRPEHIVWQDSLPAGSDNVFEGTVTDVRYMGEYCECDIELPGAQGPVGLQARMPASSTTRAGDKCRIGLPRDRVNCIAAE